MLLRFPSGIKLTFDNNIQDHSKGYKLFIERMPIFFFADQKHDSSDRSQKYPDWCRYIA